LTTLFRRVTFRRAVSNGSVSVEVVGDGITTVAWSEGMNGQAALEAAYPQPTFLLEYFGSTPGYMVVMINGTYESFSAAQAPFYFWELYVNGVPAQQGIDGTILNDGDVMSFAFVQYDPDAHAGTLLAVKHEARTRR
jgi:Domain of unknown function (DUF4430)